MVTAVAGHEDKGGLAPAVFLMKKKAAVHLLPRLGWNDTDAGTAAVHYEAYIMEYIYSFE